MLDTALLVLHRLTKTHHHATIINSLAESDPIAFMSLYKVVIARHIHV